MPLDHDFKQYPELSNAQLETYQFQSPHPQITEDFEATVVKVHDGDTVTLRTSFRDFDFPLRILDIDAPELSEGGEVSRQWLNGKILNERVTVKINSKNRVGKYGRLLGKILHNGFDIGQEELFLGLAVPFGSKNASEFPALGKVFALRGWFS